MKKLTLRKSISLDTIFVYLALICVSSFALLEHVSSTIPTFSLLKMPMMLLGALCVFTQIRIIWKNLFRKSYFYVFLTLCVLSVLLLWTAVANRNPTVGDPPMTGTIRLILYLMETFFLMMVIAETGRSRGVLRFLFWYVFIIVAINDFLLFTRLITFRAGRFENYLVGTKFSVSYLHMDLLTLWVINSKKPIRAYFSKWKVVLAAAYIMAVAIRVDCMTGVLGCLTLVSLFMLIDSPKRRKLLQFTSPTVLLLVMSASLLFVLVVDSITSIPFVTYLVEDVLGRDTTLTGRTNIYVMYVDRMPGHWLTGYGYGNGNEVAVSMFGYENVQNAFLQWVLQVGLFATGALAALMVQIFRHLRKKRMRNQSRVLPLVALIYMFIILGTIETTFNMALILWFMLAFMLVNEKQQDTLPGAAVGRG